MGEEKICRYCAMSVPKAAIVCPHCRKTIGTSRTVMGCAVLAGFLLIVFIGVAIEGSHHSYVPPTSSDQSITEQAEAIVPLTPKGEKVKAKHFNWSNYMCNLIAEKKVEIGMTAEQARAAWGRPYKINESVYGNRRDEQWVMHEYGSSYLYFENGILTSIQTSR